MPRIQSFDDVISFQKKRWFRVRRYAGDNEVGTPRLKMGSDIAGHRPQPPEPTPDMIGDAYAVPNDHWGFENVRTTDHPGLCMGIPDKQTQPVLLSKGTDLSRLRPQYRAAYFAIDPNEQNGLKKTTAFSRHFIQFSFRRVMLYYPERHLGHVDESVLQSAFDVPIGLF